MTLIQSPPNFEDVRAAAGRLAGYARETPLLSHPRLNLISGLNLYLKDETAQKTGTFKYRGAYSRLSAMSGEERARGVVAFSSGNHAQGVALAAKELGISAVIVMPDTAPEKKKQGTLSHGAEVIEYNLQTQDREEIAAEISKRDGRIVVPSFDDPYIIAGQGTCGLEIAQTCADRNISPDAVITPMGGGGLCAGTGLAVKALLKGALMFGAEPIEYDDHYRSLRSGKRETNSGYPPTFCDALLTPSPGKMTFAINRKNVEQVFRITDDECLLTMQVLSETLGVTAEAGGSVALASALTGKTGLASGSTVVVVLSGGNVDESVLSRRIPTMIAYG